MRLSPLFFLAALSAFLALPEDHAIAEPAPPAVHAPRLPRLAPQRAAKAKVTKMSELQAARIGVQMMSLRELQAKADQYQVAAQGPKQKLFELCKQAGMDEASFQALMRGEVAINFDTGDVAYAEAQTPPAPTTTEVVKPKDPKASATPPPEPTKTAAK